MQFRLHAVQSGDKLNLANITERIFFPSLDGLSPWLKRHDSSKKQEQCLGSLGAATGDRPAANGAEAVKLVAIP